jgi:hypothetical protein
LNTGSGARYCGSNNLAEPDTRTAPLAEPELAA